MTDESRNTPNDTFVGQCGNCSSKVRIPIKLLNQKVKCSRCGEAFVATQPRTDAAPAAPPPPKPNKPMAPRGPMTTIEDGVNPDELMGDFKGKKIIMVVILAIIFHAVLILGTSYGYLRDEVFGKDTSEMPKEEKVQVAIGEATAVLSKIAERHGLELEDITSRFSGSGSRSDKVADAPANTTDSGNGKTSDSSSASTGGGDAPPRSKMEEEMAKPKKGPDTDTKIDDDFGL